MTVSSRNSPTERTAPPTRASLLEALLRKRAAAQTAGAEDLEALLRDQIRWALPIERDPVPRAEAAD